MQCEASTPVCSNQGVQLLESVYMCCNKLTATCTKVNGNRLKLLTLLAKSVYICTTTFLHRVSNVLKFSPLSCISNGKDAIIFGLKSGSDLLSFW
jgi:hypothetical protein